MPRINIDQDIKPLSEFRANAASFIQQVHRTRRPMVITHRGKSAAVLMDVAEYEGLMERLDLLEELQRTERQVDDGQAISQDEARSRILGRIAQ